MYIIVFLFYCFIAYIYIIMYCNAHLNIAYMYRYLCNINININICVIIYLTIQARDWLIITMKDNKTIEIVFLKNELRTMIIFVSDLFLKANHKT